MANIMMTDVCNLNCPYCFANEFVNKKNRNEITEEAFDKAVNFVLSDGTHSAIGLIGGEPTIHTRFDYFVRKLLRNDKVKTIVVYTNGICINHFWDVLIHPKVRMLINCNSPKDIGEYNYKRLCDNLDTLFLKKEFKDYATLGINMYSEHFEYDYLLDLLKKYDLHRVRVSITVPNIDSERNINAHEHFMNMKQRVFVFFHDLLKNGIVPYFDCNKLPSCLIDEDELNEFRKYQTNDLIRDSIEKSNISRKNVVCRPVIDIRQDLTAVRCFGLSAYTKQNIFDFECISDLEKYYMRTIDAYAYNTIYSSKCLECKARQVLKCNGGCLAFKINEILEAQHYIEERNRSIK